MTYRKYDGALHWHQRMQRLGEDQHGTWLGSSAGMVTRKGHGPRIVIGWPRIILFPHDSWWTAAFSGPPARVELYCDITTPPRWPSADEVTMIDLDLDVCRIRANQEVQLLDEDEFAVHQVHYRYPQEVIDSAAKSAAWLYEAVAAGAEPFASEYQAWLALV